MEKQSIVPETLKFFNWRLTLKVMIIGMLMLILLIPKFMILELIGERKTASESVRQEIASKWSGTQVIRGPILTVPYLEGVEDKAKGGSTEEVRECHFLPDVLSVDGELFPQELHRSIYKTVVYGSKLHISGHFSVPGLKELKLDSASLMWDKARLSLGISDLRGINAEVNLVWNSVPLPFSPGMDNDLAGANGISLNLPREAKFPADFLVELDLKGSESLQFAPLGETTEVHLRSTWNDPGFTGTFLPVRREVSAGGFDAQWKVLSYNRNFPQQWKDDTFHVRQADFGVNLLKTADHYQKCARSTKYGIVVIVLIFLSFFLNEIITRQRIHPFQYILVGFAILVFYLLLLSVTEQTGFNAAYLISSLAVTAMVLLYSRSFLKTWMNAFMLTLILASAFGFIFVLLQLETYALLAGSAGLFVMLALTMFLSRKIDWYSE